MSVPVTPVIPKDFNPEWAAFVLKDWFIKNDRDVDKIKISKVEAVLNGQQGLLSTTFIVDVFFQEGDGEEEKKSLFVKIPLIGEASKNFKQVNVREYEMLTNVLPELQKYLDDHNDGFFCMGVPEVIYCYYSGDEVHDAFVIENLIDSGFLTCTTKDLHVDNNGKDYIKSTLETLSQLHGTGLHFKKSLDGNKGVLERFPKIEEQIQIKDILKNPESRNFLRKHFCAFIRYLEETDQELKNITSYMKKMETYLFKILKVLDDSGVRHLNTLCHGDAKPNNFMFRKIDIDFDDDDDEELKDLKCEGVESMLIDWQGGFLGSLCNDLMWCMFPFFEVNSHDKELYEFAFHHYYDELKNVLQTFNSDLKDFGLPEQFSEFRSLVRRGFVLEFLIVTVLRPVMNINNPEEIMKWYKKLEKYDRMKAKGGVYALLAGKKPKLPPQESVFQNPRYMEFLQFYFKIATALGAFQELGLIYFELMKDGLFKDTTSPIAEKPKPFTKPWFKNMMNISCVKGEKDSDNEDEDESYDKEDEKDPEKQERAVQETIPPIIAEDEEVDSKENLYEPIAEPEEVVIEVEVDREVREPTPDPLRTLAAQLHRQFVGYKETFNAFENVMDDFKPEPLEEEEVAQIEQSIAKASVNASKNERKLSTEEEIALVKNMSNESAWSHVVSSVMKEKKQAAREESIESKDKNVADYSKIERKISHVEEKSMMQRIMTENVVTTAVTEITKESTLSKESISTKEMNAAEARLESESISDKNTIVESHTAEKSSERMKRISMDIDISNQKVLETIEFLSSTSSNQDEETISNITSENEVSNATEICMKHANELRKDKLASPMTKNAFVESLVNDSLTDAKHIYAYTKKSENEFEKISKENILKKETLDSTSIENNVECVKPEEPTGTRNSILAWLSLSSHPKEEEVNNGIINQKEETTKEMDKIKEDDIREESQLESSNKMDEIQLTSNLDQVGEKKEEDTRSSILSWLNLGKTNTLEDTQDEKEAQPSKERTPKPQLERTFSNDLDDCKTEVENIQNNIIGLGKEAPNENGFADLKAQMLSDEMKYINMDELEISNTTPVKPPRSKESKHALALTQPTWASIAEKSKSNFENDPELPTPTDVIPLQSKKLSTIVIALDDLKAPKTVKDVDDGFKMVKSKKESNINVEETKFNLEKESKTTTSTEEKQLNSSDNIVKNVELQARVEDNVNIKEPNKLESSFNNVTIVKSEENIEDNLMKVNTENNLNVEEPDKLTWREWMNAENVKVEEPNKQESLANKVIMLESEENTKDNVKIEEQSINVASENHEVMKQEQILALTQPTWAHVAEKPKSSLELEPVLPSPADIIPLKQQKVSTIVVAVDDNKAALTGIDEDGEGFVAVKSKRESKIYHVETENTLNITENGVAENKPLNMNLVSTKHCTETEETEGKHSKQVEVQALDVNNDVVEKTEVIKEYYQVAGDYLRTPALGRRESDTPIADSNISEAQVVIVEDENALVTEINNFMETDGKQSNVLESHEVMKQEQNLALTPPTWAHVAEKPKSSLEPELMLTPPADIIPLKQKKVSTIVVAVDDAKTALADHDEDGEGFVVVKSKRESKMYCEETNNKTENAATNLVSAKHCTENALVTEINRFMETDEQSSVTIVSSENHKVMEQEQILALTPPTWAHVAEKPKSSLEPEPILPPPADIIPLKQQKVSTIVIAVDDTKAALPDKVEDGEGFVVVKSKKESNIYYEETDNTEEVVMENNENALVTEINRFMETEEPSSVTIVASENHEVMKQGPILALTPPTWAHVAEKQKSSLEPEPMLPSPAVIIPLKQQKVSTIVVAVDDTKAALPDKVEDGEGFVVVKSKRESKIYYEETDNTEEVVTENNENALVTEINRFMETEESQSILLEDDNCVAQDNLLTESDIPDVIHIEPQEVVSVNNENSLVTEINNFMETVERGLNVLDNCIAQDTPLTDSDISDVIHSEPQEVVSDNALVTEINRFTETEERQSNVTNVSDKEKSNVLDSLENVLSRKSESRMSVKKRKQINSMKSAEQLPDLIDSESNPESRRKSREVFDFYVNSIDGDTSTSGAQVSPQNVELNINKTVCTEKAKSDEQTVIENLLSSIPKDMTNNKHFDGNSTETENKNGLTENGNGLAENVKGTTEIGETDLERMDESDLPPFGSNSTSGANTLRRNWKKQNSKKKRKSRHML